ncbi:enoyl-CoA hydratase/isomerase family protein [Bacillus rubiinfantis]|uniref:enoyl-CoA hydratase/isomerase family protein n=1 Tax=Bacillus rubiinfantis TaxID=1499680 RepID=UPI0009E38D93|nr:enoyl-CoA hydratase/isomerase family protein [Bacillus rubiinfantis]
MVKYTYLDVWIQNSVAHVVLNNSGEHNVFNSEMAQELGACARELQDRDDIKVIVLGTKGKNFSIGLSPDIAEDYRDESYAAITIATHAIEEWSRLPYPIVAAIKGICSSLALSLACVADLRYAAANAVFSVPEATWGLVPGGGITQRLPRLIGKGPALSLLLGGEILQSSQALQLGLVTKVTDEDLVWIEACQKAKQLANMSTLSMQYTKECLLKGSELSLEQALRLELDIYMLLQTSQDRMEGVHAFLEKRSPQFIGE